MEPNNSFAEAIGIVSGAEHSVFCYIGHSGDVDYYKIYLKAHHTVKAKLYDLPQNYNLYLYGLNQNWLAQSTRSGTMNEELTADITADGYYYLIVDSPNNAYSDTQPYKLKVIATPNALYPDMVSDALQTDVDHTRLGKSVQFETEIKNQGNIPSTAMEFSVYEEGVHGESPQLVETGVVWPLAPGAQQLLTFRHTFNTKGERRVRLVLDSQNQIAEGNENNNITLATLLACIKGDFNCNEIIDISDIQRSAGRWNLNIGENNYDTEYDLNLNGIIDISDIQWVAGRWNQTDTRVNQEPDIKSNAATATLTFTPSTLTLETGQTTTLTFSMESPINLGAFESAFNFDPNVITITNITLGVDKAVYTALPAKIDNNSGNAVSGAYSVGKNSDNFSASQLIFIELQAVSPGETDFRPIKTLLVDRAGSEISIESQNSAGIRVAPGDAHHKVYLPVVLR